MTKEKTIPFLGRLVLEGLRDDVDDYRRKALKMSENSPIILPEMDWKARVPLKKGKIIDMAVDCFGLAFEHNYGADCAQFARKHIKCGTVVMFIPEGTYKVDAEGKYHIINDTGIIAIVEEVKEVEEESIMVKV